MRPERDLGADEAEDLRFRTGVRGEQVVLDAERVVAGLLVEAQVPVAELGRRLLAAGRAEVDQVRELSRGSMSGHAWATSPERSNVTDCQEPALTGTSTVPISPSRLTDRVVTSDRSR